jgi:hypothetical protein
LDCKTGGNGNALGVGAMIDQSEIDAWSSEMPNKSVSSTGIIQRSH